MLSKDLLKLAEDLERVEPTSKPPEGGQLLSELLPEELRQFEALFWHIARQYHAAQAANNSLTPLSPESLTKTLEVRALRRQLDWVKRTYANEVEQAYGMLGQPVRLAVCEKWEVYVTKAKDLEGLGDFFSLFIPIGPPPPSEH